MEKASTKETSTTVFSQVRSPNKVVTTVQGFHPIYPVSPLLEAHTAICPQPQPGLVLKYERIDWSALFPEGYEDSDWTITIERRFKKPQKLKTCRRHKPGRKK